MGLFNWLRGSTKPKAGIPPLSEAMNDTIAITIGVCERQIEQCFGTGTTKLPYVSDFHDDLVVTYALGFLQGTLLSNHADVVWAKGNRDLADLGWYISACAVLTGVLDLSSQGDACVDRALSCQKRLPQFRGERASGDWYKLEASGGADAMALSKGDAMHEGGQLLMMLKANLTFDEKIAMTTDRA